MAASPDKSLLSQPAEVPSGKSDLRAESETESSPESREELVEQLNQLRERFRRTTNALGSAAHDLKTPLSILNGYIELLQSEKLGSMNVKQREILADMHASGQRLQNFIQDFLAFSVLETGEMKMRFELGDMNACLSEVCRLWSHRFQERGLALYFLANDKLPRFTFDAAKIQRTISNLLENASKFTPKGGTVWLHAEPYMWERRAATKPTAGERRRQSMSAPNAAKVSVSDTGPGIPAEYHIEVFDDFFRLPAIESHTDGMGLGLAIARRLVHGMGGKIWVESEAGAGCKFSFLVPLKPVVNATVRGKSNE